MKVQINRNLCGHHPAGCEVCFGEFLRHGDVPDRSCIVSMVDDGKSDLTVDVRSGQYESTFVVNDENREQVIYDGFIKFANLPPEAYEIVPPHGEDIRQFLKGQEEQTTH